MKKLLIVLSICAIAVSSAFSFAGCNANSDYQAIKAKGYFVCGVTIYEPMSYTNDDGEMTGFDTDFANAVAEKLGLEAKFQVINWSKNFVELNSGAIDCIWNGFTVTEERSKNCDFSLSYMNNSQCVVVRSDTLASYPDAQSLAGKKGVAEAGSAGFDYATELVGESGIVNGSSSQTAALLDLLAGQSDFAVIDLLMANSMVGNGDFTTLSKVTAFAPDPEEYAVGFRKNSDFKAMVDQAIKDLAADGTLMSIAQKYGLENTVITEFGE
ncbi:MAG: transporter substrate-binding domain-containing protein [Clostridia bacterium]|nr:transporter substrate-binding domain-containing protein [Clostridia bacterium]